MKNLLALILLTTASYSQIYVSAGFDVRNLVIGSEATRNKSELDYILRLGMIGTVPNHITTLEAQVGYERFERLDYSRFFFGLGVQLYPFKDITVIPTIEPSLIDRWSNWGGGLGAEKLKSSHLTVGASLAVRYEVSYRISLEAQSCLLPRTDVYTMYRSLHNNVPIVVNNSLSVLYRF